MVRRKEYFCIRTNDYSINFTSGVIDKGLHWNIDNRIIDMFKMGELNNYNKLLCIEDLSEYQEKLLDAVNIYSKNTLRYDIFDKLLYMLVGLETMFLRNSSEPIQQNVGERMAFLIGKDIRERKDIVTTLREIYSIRSKFIHHGATFIAETNLLRKFMNYTFLCFSKLVVLMDNYKTKDELLNDLDNLKLS